MLNIIQPIKKKILEFPQKVKRNISVLKKFLPILSLIIPFLVLYSLYPNSFEATWKGRTYYLFFLWLAILELILNWEKVQTNKVKKLRSARTIAFIIVFLLPTIYVIAANYWGLNAIIEDLAKKNNVPLFTWMPLSTEYFVFTMLFALTILLAYGIKDLMDFSISIFFLEIIGLIYTIDNFYPFGRFTPFQFLVPTTATLAANVLNLMGYQTVTYYITNPYYGSMPQLTAWDSRNPSARASFAIGWPCAGVESLLIYTLTILLFLKKSAIPWKQRLIYFIIGAIVTYFINVLRIATIFWIKINGGNWELFHNYYGQLFSITWIVSYPLIIIGTRVLWSKIQFKKISTKDFL